jgi:hypothetical protein
VLLYIRLIDDKSWHSSESHKVPHRLTSKKPEVELEKAGNTNLIQNKNAEAIRKRVCGVALLPAKLA